MAPAVILRGGQREALAGFRQLSHFLSFCSWQKVLDASTRDWAQVEFPFSEEKKT